MLSWLQGQDAGLVDRRVVTPGNCTSTCSGRAGRATTKGEAQKMLRVEVERPKRDVIFIYLDTYTRWAADPVRSKVVGDL